MYEQGMVRMQAEGAKEASVTLGLLCADVKNKILEALNSANAQKQYKIDFIDVNDSYISIGFVVSMGIMKRLEPFIDWFMPIVAAWSRSLYAQCMCTGTY